MLINNQICIWCSMIYEKTYSVNVSFSGQNISRPVSLNTFCYFLIELSLEVLCHMFSDWSLITNYSLKLSKPQHILYFPLKHYRCIGAVPFVTACAETHHTQNKINLHIISALDGNKLHLNALYVVPQGDFAYSPTEYDAKWKPGPLLVKCEEKLP
jgi:hypothetical protein